MHDINRQDSLTWFFSKCTCCQDVVNSAEEGKQRHTDVVMSPLVHQLRWKKHPCDVCYRLHGFDTTDKLAQYLAFVPVFVCTCIYIVRLRARFPNFVLKGLKVTSGRARRQREQTPPLLS